MTFLKRLAKNLPAMLFGLLLSAMIIEVVLRLYNDVLRKVGKENGLLVIDLAQKMPHNSLYYYDFMHYTNEGAQKVAEIIFEDLYPFVIERGFAH